MKPELKLTIHINRLLGEFIGTLEGISYWDITEDQKKLLNNRIEELKNLKIEGMIEQAPD